MKYKTLKENDILYPKLQLYVGERGKEYDLTYRSENRPNGYKEIKSWLNKKLNLK